MMASSSAFNFEVTCSINFPTDKGRFPDSQIGSSSFAEIRDAQSIGILGRPGARQLQPSEDRLLNEAKAGNEHAFVELFQRYSPQLEQTIFRIVRNRQDTEDVVQETMLRRFWRLACRLQALQRSDPGLPTQNPAQWLSLHLYFPPGD